MSEQTTIPGVEVAKERKTYPKLKSIKDIPVSRSQLTHDWMLKYTMENGTPEQCAALLDFIKTHQVERDSHLTTCKGVKYQTTDIKPMRTLFCEMFFPALKEPKPSGKQKESQLDKAIRLLSEKAAQANKPQSASKSKK